MNSLLSHFDITETDDRGRRWAVWKRRLEALFITKKEENDDVKLSYLFLFGGDELTSLIMNNYNNITVFKDLMAALDGQFNPAVNHDVNIYNFRRVEQHEGETVEEFVARVKAAAPTSCATAAARHGHTPTATHVRRSTRRAESATREDM